MRIILHEGLSGLHADFFHERAYHWVEAFLDTSNKSSLKIVQTVKVLMKTYLRSSMKSYFMNQPSGLPNKRTAKAALEHKHEMSLTKLNLNLRLKDWPSPEYTLGLSVRQTSLFQALSLNRPPRSGKWNMCGQFQVVIQLMHRLEKVKISCTTMWKMTWLFLLPFFIISHKVGARSFWCDHNSNFICDRDIFAIRSLMTCSLHVPVSHLDVFTFCSLLWRFLRNESEC